MPVTPTGPISLPIQNLINTLAACETFQEVVDADDATEALGSIFWWQLQGEIRNRAMVRTLTQFERERTTFDSWRTTGPLLLFLELQFPAEHTIQQDRVIWGCNTVGNIVQELMELAVSNPATSLNITQIQEGELGILDPVSHNGASAWGAELIVHWQGQ